MKKFSAVLLILALVGGALFASFTGSAGVSFGVDLDGKTYGFANSTSLSAELNFLELLVDKAGEGDIYAEIKAEMSLGLKFDKVGSGFAPFGTLSTDGITQMMQAELDAFIAEWEEDNDKDFDYDELSPDEKLVYDEMVDFLDTFGATSVFTGVAKITSAKIIGDNWYVGILGAMDAPNFAASAVDLDADGDALLDLAFAEPGAGVEVGYADYKFGLSVVGDYGAETYNFFLSAVTPEYEFADGLTAQFGAAGQLSDTAMGGFASVAVGYELDDLSVSLATDLEFGKDLFDFEVAVAAAYDFLTADLYYGLKDSGVYTGEDHIISVGLGADIAGFDIGVYGKDLIHQQIISAEVGYAVTEEISVGVEGGYTISGPDKGAWAAGANVKYAADMFTATASAGLEGAEEVDEVIVKVGASTDKLIAGATLALDYVSGNLAADPAGAGTITAKATIAF